jgi:hypothetical protein
MNERGKKCNVREIVTVTLPQTCQLLLTCSGFIMSSETDIESSDNDQTDAFVSILRTPELDEIPMADIADDTHGLRHIEEDDPPRLSPIPGLSGGDLVGGTDPGMDSLVSDHLHDILDSPAIVERMLFDGIDDDDAPTPAGVNEATHVEPDSAANLGHPKKKSHRRLATAHVKRPASHIAKLPLEMLAEVLSDVGPDVILALAWTCQFFYHTLTNPTATWMWRRARLNYRPLPVPEPTPNWSEPKYAYNLFSRRPCVVCKRETDRLPLSFGLRIKVCKDVRALNLYILGSKSFSSAKMRQATSVSSFSACDYVA